MTANHAAYQTHSTNRSNRYEKKRSVYTPMTENERKFHDWMAKQVTPSEIMVREYNDYLNLIKSGRIVTK